MLISITYYGDYGFSDFMKTGAADWKDYDRYIRNTLVHGVASNIDVSGTQCASFIAYNPEDDVLFGRNFDYTFAPVVMTATSPSDGYAVLGASELGFLNFGRREKIIPHALTMTNAIYKVLIGIHDSNIGSWKTVEKCGGVLKNTVKVEYDEEPIRRYWITLPKE